MWKAIDLQTRCLVSEDGNWWVEDAEDKPVYLAAAVDAELHEMNEMRIERAELGTRHERLLQHRDELEAEVARLSRALEDEKAQKADATRVDGVPSDRSLGSTASNNEVE